MKIYGVIRTYEQGSSYRANELALETFLDEQDALEHAAEWFYESNPEAELSQPLDESELKDGDSSWGVIESPEITSEGSGYFELIRPNASQVSNRDWQFVLTED